MLKLKTVKIFFHRHEAEMAQGLLEDAKIKSVVKADDAGGFRPDLTLGMGNVKLMVNEQLFEQAKEVLAVLDDEV